MITCIDEPFFHDLLISSITLVEIMDIIKAYNLPLETLKRAFTHILFVCIQSRNLTLKVWQAIGVIRSDHLLVQKMLEIYICGLCEF